MSQVRKYQGAVKKVVAKTHPDQDQWIETIGLLGHPPLPENERAENDRMLRSVNAR